MSNGSSRRKGNRGENELAKKIGAEKISRAGYIGPDLFWRHRYIEVKREAKPISKRINILLEDAQIVADRGDQGEWIAHLRWDELLDLLTEAASGNYSAELTECRIREAELMEQNAQLSARVTTWEP